MSEQVKVRRKPSYLWVCECGKRFRTYKELTRHDRSGNCTAVAS